MAPALQTHRLSWIDVFQDKGKLDDLPEGEATVRLKEHTTGTEVTRDARSFQQFHGYRDPKSGSFPPVWNLQCIGHVHNLRDTPHDDTIAPDIF